MTTTWPAPPPPGPALRERTWPGPSVPARPAALVSAGTAGAVAALALPGSPPGVGIVAVGALVAATVGLQRPRGWTRTQRGLAALAGALLAVTVVRDAEWLVALCLLASGGLGALAVSSAVGWSGVLLTPVAAGLAALRALAWAARGTPSGHVRGWLSALRTAVVTALLLGVFGALLAAADAAFARLVDVVLPEVRVGEVPGRLVLAAVVASLAVGAAYLAVAPPRWALLRVPPGRPASRTEWLVPLVALDLLLLAFLLVQSAVLFGGADHVRATAGLTWAEYARSGFWQLLVVTALVLVVVAAAVRWAPRPQPQDRWAVRGALGLLLGLTLAVAASALTRLHLYEQAYGTTRARLMAAVVELWLVVVLLLVARAGARWPDAAGPGGPGAVGWLPRAVVASAGLALLGLAVVDADGLVARRNVDRHLDGASVDTAYLSGLSADAVPSLDRLPEPQRSCALAPLARRLATADDGWAGAHLARSAARRLLDERPVQEVDAAACGR